jgi:hypothetical protein
MSRVAIAVSVILSTISIAAAQQCQTADNGSAVVSLSASNALVDEMHVGIIDKVGVNKITFTIYREKNVNKFLTGGKIKGTKGEVMMLYTADQVKIARASFDPTAKKPKNAGVIIGDDISGGLKNEIFSKGNARVRITVNNDNKVTQILVFDKKCKPPTRSEPA